MSILHSGRLRNSSGRKYYISLDTTFGSSSYSVYSFSNNTDYDNKTGTLMYTESLRKFKKGATDDLVNDNATLIDEYGSIDFLDTVRTQVLNSISR
mgnify:CR=1 FL=1|tara:strand:- start:244 stop:531 length:288 start_codon:yes stop_codon:yes gene_type:complete